MPEWFINMYDMKFAILKLLPLHGILECLEESLERKRSGKGVIKPRGMSCIKFSFEARRNYLFDHLQIGNEFWIFIAHLHKSLLSKCHFKYERGWMNFMSTFYGLSNSNLFNLERSNKNIRKGDTHENWKIGLKSKTLPLRNACSLINNNNNRHMTTNCGSKKISMLFLQK